MFKQIDAFHKTRKGYVVLAAVEAVLLYVFASIAIDTANMFAYLAAVIFLFGTVHNIAMFVFFKPKKRAHGRR